LFELLDAAATQPVTWLTAPPGAGKTSLISSYIEARRLPTIWYQVDSGDADPATFFYYLGIAASDLLGRKAKPLPMFTQDFAPNLPDFTRRYFRSLFEQVPESFVLVLDNYQEAAEGSAFHGAIRDAFDQIPEGVRVVSISRSEPQPELSRLRAAKRLTLIGWDALKLTLNETVSIASVGHSHDAAHLEELHRHTNGWAAGLILMLERLKQTGQINHLAGSENLEMVFDYFATQLFDAASAETRDMLLRMSYLPRLTAETAQVISGKANAGALLADLSKRNLFTDRRYGDETSFQFHALFRTFLREKARHQLDISEHERLASSAAALLQTTGQIEEAFALHVESGAWDVAARLIAREAEGLIHQGRRQTLRQWISALPFDTMQSDPWLLYWYGMSLMGLNHAKGRKAFADAYDLFESIGELDGMIVSGSAAMDSVFNERIGWDVFDPWIDRLIPLLRDHIPENDSAVIAHGFASLGRALILHRSLAPELEWCVEHMRRLLDSQPASIAVPIGTIVMMSDSFRGDFELADGVASKINPLLNEKDVLPASVIWWQFWYSQYLTTSGRYSAALAIQEEGSQLVDESGMAPMRTDFSRIRAITYRCMGDEITARKILDQEVAPYLPEIRRGNLGLYYAQLAHFSLGAGDVERATIEYQKGLEILRDFGVQLAVVFMNADWLDLLAARGKFTEWEQEYAKQSALCQGTWLLVRTFSLKLNLAYYEYCRGSENRFVPALVEALRYGRDSRRVVRSSAFAPVLSCLFSEALACGIEPQYVIEQIKLRNLRAPHADIEAWPWSLKVYCLGAFSVIDADGKSMAKSQRKLIEILMALVAYGPVGANTQDLADELWPDSDGDTAQNSLQVSIHRLRKMLGREDAILLEGGKLSINSRVCWVDAYAFEAKIKRLKKLDANDTQCARLSSEALSLYRDHLLTKEKEQPWMLAPRERLRRLWLGLVRDNVQILERATLWQQAAEIYQRALDIDLTNEDLWRHLMLCQQESGERPEALKTYQRCKAQLAVKLNTKPSPDTERLYQSLCKQTE
jgi:two-component SAPR family response regulator